MATTDSNKGNIKTKKKSTVGQTMTLIVLLFALLLIVSLVLLWKVSKKQSALEGADSSIRLSAQSGFDCEFAEAQKLYPFGEGVLKVTPDRVSYLTVSGNEVYGNDMNYQNPQCVFNNGKAAVADIDGYGFSVFDSESVIFSISTQNQIKYISLSNDGKCAIVTDSDDSYGQVSIYDEKGNFIADWVSYDSGYPISAQFNDASDILAITSVNTNGAEFQPFLKLLSITSKNDSYEASDYAVYSLDVGAVPGLITYSGNSLYAFTNNSVYILKDDVLSKLNFDFGSVNYAFNVGSNLFVIYSDGVEQVNKLAVINSSNNIVYNSPIGTVINNFCVEEDRCVISVDNRVFVFKQNGEIQADISVDEDILRLSFIGNDRILAVSTSGVHTINY